MGCYSLPLFLLALNLTVGITTCSNVTTTERKSCERVSDCTEETFCGTRLGELKCFQKIEDNATCIFDSMCKSDFCVMSSYEEGICGYDDGKRKRYSFECRKNKDCKKGKVCAKIQRKGSLTGLVCRSRGTQIVFYIVLPIIAITFCLCSLICSTSRRS